MDPRRNPYAPGAGTPPPELAGRSELLESASVAISRISNGRAARSFILYGLRGVGKTVLLNEIRIEAEANGLACVLMEAPEGRSLPSILVPSLRSALLRMSRRSAVAEQVQRALRTVAGFAKTFKMKYQDVEMSFDLDPIAGVADSGDLDFDLAELIEELGKAAIAKETAMIMFIDEIQYVEESHLAALIMALHRASQSKLPITLVAAGLPQLLGQMGKAKSYAERLFEFIPVGALEPNDARDAIVVPAQKEGVEYDHVAVAMILDATKCYPYFLQEWGKHSWSVAENSPIVADDVRIATAEAVAMLDASFFRVRFDRLTPAEKRYMRAMAELGEGPHRSGDVAELLGRKVNSVAPTRSLLIKKGMAYSRSHGDIAFTVPLFDGFMKRIMDLET